MGVVKKYSIKKCLVFPLVLVSLFFLVICFFKTGQILTVRAEDGLASAIFPLKETETFQVRFNHSLYHVPQTEKWKVDSGSLELEEVRFGNLAAAEYYDRALTYQRAGGGEWVYRPTKSLTVEKILIRVGYIAQHTLLWRGQVIPFTKYISSGELAVLQLEQRPLIWIVYMKLRFWRWWE